MIVSVLGKLSIRQKLTLMAIVPLIAVAYLATMGVLERYQQVRDLNELHALVELATTASAVVHETQKERGSTSIFMGSAGATFKTELAAQRAESDKRIAQYHALVDHVDAGRFGPAFATSLQAINAKLDGIPAHRRAVDGLTIPAAAGLGYYTELNGMVIDAIGDVSRIGKNAELGTRMVSYASLLAGKEQSGLERALLSGAFTKDRFEGDIFARFAATVAGQSLNLKSFVQYATPEQRLFYDAKMGAPVVADVLKLRQAALDHARDDSLGKVDATQWFKLATDRINLLKEVEDRL